jgi:hypothetical protein
LVDCRDRELRELPLREGDREAVLLVEPDLLLELRLAVLRVPADELFVLRPELRDPAARRVVDCAILPPFIRCSPALGTSGVTRTRIV